MRYILRATLGTDTVGHVVYTAQQALSMLTAFKKDGCVDIQITGHANELITERTLRRAKQLQN